MHTATTSLATGDGPMSLYEAIPDARPVGAVLVIQEAFGVNDHIEDVTRRFAERGFRALAPHLFHRTGDPALAYDNLDQVMPHLQALTVEGLEADLGACLAHLADHDIPSGQVAVVGFCMGGTVAFFAGTRWALGAAVTFYGGGVVDGRFGLPPLVELAAVLRTPWLGLYGDQDHSIPVAHVERLRTALGSVPVDTELVRYPEAGHGFHCDQRPDHFDPPSAADAWRRTLEWLERHLRR